MSVAEQEADGSVRFAPVRQAINKTEEILGGPPKGREINRMSAGAGQDVLITQTLFPEDGGGSTQISAELRHSSG